MTTPEEDLMSDAHNAKEIRWLVIAVLLIIGVIVLATVRMP